MSKNAIYLVVREIPSGTVTTYGDVAKRAGLGRAARLVGTTLKNLPKDSSLPWHRVINSQGKISFPPASAAYLRQKKKLIAENIVFKGERIDLKLFGWGAKDN